MSSKDIPPKGARVFRLTNAVLVVLFGAAAAWLFATSRAPIVAWILAVAAAFALVDAVVGWRKSSE